MDSCIKPQAIKSSILSTCRETLDAPLKRTARIFSTFALKHIYGFRALGEGFQFGLPFDIRRGNVSVGKYTYIGRNFSAMGGVEIGDLVLVSMNVHIFGNDHGIDSVGTPLRVAPPLGSTPNTIICSEVWIGMGALIKEGVKIGRGAVVAAGSVVTRDVEAYSIVAGSPAKLIRKRFSEAQIREHEAALYE